MVVLPFWRKILLRGDSQCRLRYIRENNGASLYKNRCKYNFDGVVIIVYQFRIVAAPVTELFV